MFRGFFIKRNYYLEELLFIGFFVFWDRVLGFLLRFYLGVRNLEGFLGIWILGLGFLWDLGVFYDVCIY